MTKLLLIKHSMPILDPTTPAPEWHLGERGRALTQNPPLAGGFARLLGLSRKNPPTFTEHIVKPALERIVDPAAACHNALGPIQVLPAAFGGPVLGRTLSHIVDVADLVGDLDQLG